jgi:hypothetical protein
MYCKEEWMDMVLWASPGAPEEEEEEGVDPTEEEEDGDGGTSFPGPDVEEDPTGGG